LTGISALPVNGRSIQSTLNQIGLSFIFLVNFREYSSTSSNFYQLFGILIKKGAPISAIDTGRFKGKHQRGELLVLLKDKACLKYREIAEFEIFGDLSFESLRSLYRNIKKKKTEV